MKQEEVKTLKSKDNSEAESPNSQGDSPNSQGDSPNKMKIGKNI